MKVGRDQGVNAGDLRDVRLVLHFSFDANMFADWALEWSEKAFEEAGTWSFGHTGRSWRVGHICGKYLGLLRVNYQSASCSHLDRLRCAAAAFVDGWRGLFDRPTDTVGSKAESILTVRGRPVFDVFVESIYPQLDSTSSKQYNGRVMQ